MLYRKMLIYPSDGYFKDISELQPPRRSTIRIHVILFIATIFTTTAVGAIMWANMSGGDPFTISGFVKGFPFSLTILSILGIHEFAHYYIARRWGIQVTLPYFIPAPILPIGTFGAVIKMKSTIPTRKALIDVGASGPIAGFLVALVACIIGLHMSQVVPVETHGNFTGYILGESILFKLLIFFILGPGQENHMILLHPVAYAGWIGLFVTALNLIPIGQLDGGHVLFALSPQIHDLIRRIRMPVLILLGFTFWSGWYVWAMLSLFFFGRSHPYPDRMDSFIGVKRKIIAFIAILLFILCITPTPIEISLS
ncbi:MAG TPA: site-2 protease family protein [Anaerolineae bacterium]|nr:site-2 protease family protein [Anaerolineae bacterium]